MHEDTITTLNLIYKKVHILKLYLKQSIIFKVNETPYNETHSKQWVNIRQKGVEKRIFATEK